MSNEITTKSCPLCQEPAEIGYLKGFRQAFLNNGMLWHKDKPSFWKSFSSLGEPLGNTEIFYGSYLIGIRCDNCKKLILDL